MRSASRPSADDLPE